MDVELAEVQDSIATVLAEECQSLAVHGFIDGRDPLDQRLLRLAAELGWLAIAIPEEQGGLGLGAAGLAMLHFELGRVAAPGQLLETSIALEVVARSEAARDERIAALLADVLAGMETLAIAAEPARAAGDRLVLLGSPDAAAAVVAGDDDDLVLVDLSSAGAKRIAIWDETRSLAAIAPADGPALAVLPGARPQFEALFAIALAADSAGAARGTLDRTVAYMKEREQFGRPIGSFQALKHRAADHLVAAIAAEQLVWQAVDNAARAGCGSVVWAAMAKANGTDAAVRIAGDCVQLHGGVGFTREYDPQLFLKRVRLNETLLAPNGALRDRAERAFGEALRSGHDVLEIA